MSKRIKFILFSIAIIFSLFLTSCRYEMFFEEDNNKIGETEHFIISKDSMGEYYDFKNVEFRYKIKRQYYK